MSRQAHDFLMKPVSLIPVIDETGASILLKIVFRQQSDVWTATSIDNFLSFYVYCFHTGTAFVQFGRISCRTIVFCLFFYNLHGDEDALYHCHNPFHTLAARSGHDERLGWFCAFVTDRSGCRTAVRHSVREALVIANSVLTGK